MKTIAVYGSSMVMPGQPDYRAAQQIGQALAQASYAVVSGGYAGVMEAVSRGASESNGTAVGVTTTSIERYRSTKVNQWVNQHIHYDTLRERIAHLVTEPDGYVVMPGGLGTLNELVSVWELIRVGDLPRRPIILYGDYWTQILEPFKSMPYFKPESWEYLQFASDPAQVIAQLQQAFDHE